MEQVKKQLENYQKNNIEVSLLVSLDEALKDPVVAKISGSLNMPKEELCKYTSILEESAKEYKNCQGCKGLAMCKNKIDGFVYLPKKENNKLKFRYKACKYQEEQRKKYDYLKNIYQYNIPLAIREAQMGDIYIDDPNRFETIKWLKEFIKNYSNNKRQKGLYLCGAFGVGKTYLLSAMINELAKNNVKSAILYWPEFLNSLKMSFQDDSSNFRNDLERIKKMPILFIDDIGAENMTAWSRDDVLSPILQYRMQESLPTFFTSNFNPKELEAHFATSKEGKEEVKARRIMERIKQLTEIQEMNSANLRK